MSPYSESVVQNEMSYNMIQYCLNRSLSLSSGVFPKWVFKNYQSSFIAIEERSLSWRTETFPRGAAAGAKPQSTTCCLTGAAASSTCRSYTVTQKHLSVLIKTCGSILLNPCPESENAK